MTRLSHTLTIPATTRTTTMACEGGDVDDDAVESMSHSARSLQCIGTDIGQSSHLPDTTEPYTNHNTTYNDNNNTTIATTTRTTALTCVLVMMILTMTLTTTFLTLRTTLYDCWVYIPWKSLKPTSTPVLHHACPRLNQPRSSRGRKNSPVDVVQYPEWPEGLMQPTILQR